MADGGTLEILDVSDPTSPVRVGSFDTGGDAVRVAVRLLEGVVDHSHVMTDQQIEAHLAEAGRLLAAVPDAPCGAS